MTRRVLGLLAVATLAIAGCDEDEAASPRDGDGGAGPGAGNADGGAGAGGASDEPLGPCLGGAEPFCDPTPGLEWSWECRGVGVGSELHLRNCSLDGGRCDPATGRCAAELQECSGACEPRCVSATRAVRCEPAPGAACGVVATESECSAGVPCWLGSCGYPTAAPTCDCGAELDPSCGTDGRAYVNACQRVCAGVELGGGCFIRDALHVADTPMPVEGYVELGGLAVVVLPPASPEGEATLELRREPFWLPWDDASLGGRFSTKHRGPLTASSLSRESTGWIVLSSARGGLALTGIDVPQRHLAPVGWLPSSDDERTVASWGDGQERRFQLLGGEVRVEASRPGELTFRRTQTLPPGPATAILPWPLAPGWIEQVRVLRASLEGIGDQNGNFARLPGVEIRSLLGQPMPDGSPALFADGVRGAPGARERVLGWFAMDGDGNLALRASISVPVEDDRDGGLAAPSDEMVGLPWVVWATGGETWIFERTEALGLAVVGRIPGRGPGRVTVSYRQGYNGLDLVLLRGGEAAEVPAQPAELWELVTPR